jgi:hypothetical protein
VTKLKTVLFGLGLATLMQPVAFAATSDSLAIKTTAAVDEILKPIFDGMVKGDYRKPLMTAFDRSTLWKQKVTEKENLLNQIDGAFKLYGPALSYELVSTKQRGSLWESRVYIVQQRDNITRWQIWMTRSGSGWMVGYFGFDDQAQNWFAD